MERLTEKQSAGYDLIAMNGDYCEAYCRQQNYNSCRECGIHEAIQKLAEYEDLEEQGLLLRLPCKVGDTIYRCGDPIKKVYEWDIEHIEIFYDEIVFIDDSDNSFTVGDIGKTVFLTREEAEAKMKELEGE